MEVIKEKFGTRSQADMRLYIEVSDKTAKTPNGKSSWFQNDSQSGTIMIFIKYYDPFTSTLE